MAKSSGQIKLAEKVQTLDRPACDPPKNSVASPCVQSVGLNSIGVRQKGKLPPSKIAWTSKVHNIQYIALYGNSKGLNLPFKSLNEEFMIGGVEMYCNTKSRKT